MSRWVADILIYMTAGERPAGETADMHRSDSAMSDRQERDFDSGVCNINLSVRLGSLKVYLCPL